jgi:class 3 adenylate cyclase/tetratricopeptide (TPR) repeat protein
VPFTFENCSLDTDRRELTRGAELVAVEPQVFDVLVHLVLNRDRVVSRDDLLAAVWGGRIVSESTLASRINSARSAIGDSGVQQRLIRTIARKGFRFVGDVREGPMLADAGPVTLESQRERDDATSPSEPGSASPERRQLTIMACDIGAAALSARLDPEDLREVTTAFYDCVKGVVEPHGGIVAKSMTEGVLVYFGYPQAHEDDAERAVRAGLAATRAVPELKIECLASPLQARVGIATGLVVVGDAIDTRAIGDHRVVGETPHLASRLLAIADPGAVVISAATRRLIGALFDYSEFGAVKLEGMAEPVKASRVLRESGIVSRFEALRSVETDLIGREEELELLLRRWNQAQSGEGRVVLIWGEPGIGKSRLAAALQDTVKVGRHARLLFFCSPHRVQTALHPVISQLERAAGFEPTDSDPIKLAKLESLLVSPSEEGPSAVALFAELLSIPTGDRYPPLSLSPRRRKELVLERVIAQLVSLATRQPVLMILEDAHWIDPTTRELFDIIIERVRGLPVLLVITYRPEFVPPWLGRSHVTVLTLNRLGHRENALMISRVAGGKTLPSALMEQIVTRTDGVPLFIEEMTKSVLESGILREEDGAFVAAADALPALAVPATLQASLVARLDRIAHVRAVGQTGAALGRDFAYAVLKAVLKLPDSELAPLLEQLVASELVHQRGTVPDALYTFKHALVQDAVYETLLKSQRIQLQGRIVVVLENEFPATVERNPDVLAYHCTEAGLWEKAIEYWLRSARMALDRSAAVEAQSQVEKGANLLRKLPENATRQQFEGCLQVVVGSTSAMTKGFASPDVARALSKGVQLLDESVHPIESLHALCGLFNYHMIRSESPKGLELAQPLLHRSQYQPSTMVINFLVGTANLHMGNFAASRAHLEKARSLYEETACRPVALAGGFHIGSFILVWLSLAYLFIGSFKQAADTISAAVKDARRRTHPFTLVSTLLAQARFLNHTRDLEGAIAATEEGHAIAVEQRSPYHVARAGILRAWNVVERGRAEEGIALMERALGLQRDTGGNFQSSYNLSRLAEAHARAGNSTQAIQFATQSVEEVERTGERWWQAEAHRTRGEILMAISPAGREEAEACFLRALECARSQGAKFWELHAAYSIAKLWSLEDRHVEARNLLAPVYSLYTDNFELPVLKDAKALLDKF